MYIDVFTLCPGVSWPPLSTIVTLLLGWASYCVCASNARCDAFLYCLVLLMRIHSELRVWVWYPQSDHLVVGSMWYHQTVWEAHWVCALGTVYCDCWIWDYLHWQSVSREWGPFGPIEHVVSLDWYVVPDFRLYLPCCCAQFVSCFDDE